MIDRKALALLCACLIPFHFPFIHIISRTNQWALTHSIRLPSLPFIPLDISCSHPLSLCNGWVHPACCGLDIRSDDAFKLGERSFECPLCRSAEFARSKKAGGGGGGGGAKNRLTQKRLLVAAAKVGVVPDKELPLALFKVGESIRVPVCVTRREFEGILSSSSSSSSSSPQSLSPGGKKEDLQGISQQHIKEERWRAFDDLRRALGCYLGRNAPGDAHSEEEECRALALRGGGSNRLARRVAVNTQRQVKFFTLVNRVLERGAVDDASGALSLAGADAYKRFVHCLSFSSPLSLLLSCLLSPSARLQYRGVRHFLCLPHSLFSACI